MNKPQEDPFRHLELSEAIDLRWTLRDIRSQRWKLAPINPAHIEKLREMGLVEMREDGVLMLTNAGLEVIA